MNKFLPLITALFISGAAYADINITDGEKYRIASSYYSGYGAVVLGSYHSATPYVYYVTSYSSVPDDGWWTIKKDGNGYTISNALTNQFLTYSSEREKDSSGNYLSKGIVLSDDISNDYGRWTFEQSGSNAVIIRNLGETSQSFNLRVDGTYLLGTYSNANDENSIFLLYDTNEKNIVSETTSGSTGGGSSESNTENVNGNIDGTKLSGALASYADSLRINGKDIIYNSTDQSYFASIPQATRNSSAELKVEIVPTTNNGTYSIAIDGEEADEEGNITLPAVSGTETSTLRILKDGAEVTSADLHFTFLPIVEVTVASCNSSSYSTGSIRVTDPETAGYDSTYIAAYKYRGATASGKPKKSYAIKMRDANGASVDHKYLDLRSDNNWILDAMYIDGACMRNRVATDLWNDFSEKPYHRREGWEKKARNGTRGKFVEVFLNGSYHGLYCMTEKLDRKQLKLKKYVEATTKTSTTAAADDTIHGTLYKSYDWSYEVFMGHKSDTKTFPMTAPSSYSGSTKSETWSGYEVKYPDYADERADWGPLWNAINFVATASDTEFDNNIGTWFDFPVLKDYYLFIELLLATDNHGKNMFFYNYDLEGSKYATMIGIAPWDLDGTWGARWDGSETLTKADQDFDNFLWTNEHGQHTIYYRLQNSTYWNWTNQLKTRYAELRTSYFDEESLIKRFTDYGDLFTDSGADSRESDKWGTTTTTVTDWRGQTTTYTTTGAHTDIPKDVEYIKEWIHDRLAYLDTQYDFDLTATNISKVTENKPYASAVGGNGCIRIHATQPTSVNIYTVSGVLVRSVELSQPITLIDGLNAGIYIVGDSKVIVK